MRRKFPEISRLTRDFLISLAQDRDEESSRVLERLVDRILSDPSPATRTQSGTDGLKQVPPESLDSLFFAFQSSLEASLNRAKGTWAEDNGRGCVGVLALAKAWTILLSKGDTGGHIKSLFDSRGTGARVIALMASAAEVATGRTQGALLTALSNVARVGYYAGISSADIYQSARYLLVSEHASVRARACNLVGNMFRHSGHFYQPFQE